MRVIGILLVVFTSILLRLVVLFYSNDGSKVNIRQSGGVRIFVKPGMTLQESLIPR